MKKIIAPILIIITLIILSVDFVDIFLINKYVKSSCYLLLGLSLLYISLTQKKSS